MHIKCGILCELSETDLIESFVQTDHFIAASRPQLETKCYNNPFELEIVVLIGHKGTSGISIVCNILLQVRLSN